MTLIPVRLGVQQRVLPAYRVPFFEMLASNCNKGMSLFAGTPRQNENVNERTELKNVPFTLAHNHHILGGPFYLCWQSGFIKWLESWQPEALIVESNPRYLRTPAAVRWMHRRDRPVICWGLGAPIKKDHFQFLRLASWRRFVQHFDAVIAYSEQGAHEYTALGFPKERVFVAPNAVTPRPVQPLKERPAQFSSGKPVILFVGRLQARKRVDLLIHACADLPQLMQPQLWIVGEGSARTDLEKLVQRVYPDTVFYGARYGAELNKIYIQADLFVLPGTGGLAVQQAMSFGLPVLVAEADGTQSNLVRPANGWIIPPASLTALTKMLNHALSDAGRLRQMGQASYHIIQQEINLENMVEVFARAVQAVTEG